MTWREFAPLLYVRVLVYCATARDADVIRLPGEGVGMKFHRMIALWVILAAAAGVARAQNPATAGSSSGSPAAGARVLTVDDYFRIREVGDPQISPDGKWVAYTVKTTDLKDDKNRRRIWMVPSGGGNAIPLTDEN